MRPVSSQATSRSLLLGLLAAAASPPRPPRYLRAGGLVSPGVFIRGRRRGSRGVPGARATPLSYPRPPRTATRRTTAPWTPHVGRRGVLSAPRAGRGPAGGAARAARGGGGPRHGAELEGAPALSMVWAVTAGDAGEGAPSGSQWRGVAAAPLRWVGFAAGSAGPSFSLGPLAISCCFRAFQEKKQILKTGKTVLSPLLFLSWIGASNHNPISIS